MWIAALALLLNSSFFQESYSKMAKIISLESSYTVALENHWIGPLSPGSVVGAVTWSTLEGRPVAEGNGDSPSAQTGLDVAPLWSCRHEPSGEREREGGCGSRDGEIIITISGYYSTILYASFLEQGESTSGVGNPCAPPLHLHLLKEPTSNMQCTWLIASYC